MSILTLTLIFLGIVMLGMPIVFSLGITGIIAMFSMGNVPLQAASQMMYISISQFSFLAVPCFILAGELMNEAGITRRLINFADVLFGRIPGGLAHTNIVGSMLFAGITGAAVSDCAALGSIMIPAMEEKGFDKDYSTAVTISAALVGPIIPPSLIAVIMGITVNLSIGALFIAGYIPGLLLGLGFMIVAYIQAKQRNYPRRERMATIREIGKATKEAIIPLLMPIIIIGGILGGIFTATESAVVACIYALFVGLFITKKIQWKHLPKLFMKTAAFSAVIQMLLAMTGILSFSITAYHIAESVAAVFLSVSSNPTVILIMINLLLLLLGMPLEPGPIIVILAPILFPLLPMLNIHPIHFAMIFSINVIIGMVTPPAGSVLFVGASIGKISVERISVAMIPYYFVMLLALILITFLPDLTLFLPRIFGYL